MVLSGTEELHERISQLQGRIRELETGLRTMQEAVSNDPHPLLQNDTLRLPPMPPSQPNSSPSASSSSKSSAAVSQLSPTQRTQPVINAPKIEEEDNAIDAFGTFLLLWFLFSFPPADRDLQVLSQLGKTALQYSLAKLPDRRCVFPC
jgi:hypothetical protein